MVGVGGRGRCALQLISHINVSVGVETFKSEGRCVHSAEGMSLSPLRLRLIILYLKSLLLYHEGFVGFIARNICELRH